MSDLTTILNAAAQGEANAANQLLPLVYNELRQLAAQKLIQEAPGQTLQATALVHEAYVRLAGGEELRWDSRGHFFAAAAEAMRRILIDQARRKQSVKHGGALQRVDLDGAAVQDAPEERVDDLLALDDALRQLEIEDPAKARLVHLRYFAGLSVDEAAAALGIAPATAKRHWVYARSWLYGKLNGE